LSRSFGIVDGDDLVVEMGDDGTVRIREEPVHRKLKRGEVLPEVVLDVREIWDRRADTEPAGAVESLVDRLMAAVPIADLSGTPEQVGYKAKAFLMGVLKKEKNDELP
jgi:hypothetical protein